MQPISRNCGQGAFTVRYETEAEKKAFEQNWSQYQSTLKIYQDVLVQNQVATAQVAADKALFEKIEQEKSQLRLEISAAQEKIDAAQANIEIGQAKIDAGQAKIDAGQVKIDAGQAKIDAGQAMIDAGQEMLEKALALRERKRTSYLGSVDKSIIVLSRKISIVNKLNETSEKQAILHDLNALSIQAAQFKQEIQNAASVDKYGQSLPIFVQECNSIFAKIKNLQA